MIMIKENKWNGQLLTIPQGTPLPEEMKQRLLEKWDMANEDGEIDDLIAHCETIASPKAFIRAAEAEDPAEDGCTLGGVRFKGTLVAEKLNHAGGTVVGYVITCGRELHSYAESLADDVLLQQAAMDLCLAYLRIIGSEVHKYVKETWFADANMAALNPGSLSTWPISGQRPLFDFLGQGADETGVELTDSMLMIPYKSGSGVYFRTEKHYENCMRCPRLDCPNRRAPFREDEA